MEVEMSLVYAMMADGFEETEAITVIDILRRAGIKVVTVSITDNKMVNGSHGINVQADEIMDNIDFNSADMIFLPGGGQGTANLAADKKLSEVLLSFDSSKKRIAAICAAPSIIGQLGLLKGRKATCYPGWEDKLIDAELVDEYVITDDNITTGTGVGTAIDMGLELIKVLCGDEKSNSIAEMILFKDQDKKR